MKKLLAKHLSWLLALFSAPFLPTPAYAIAVAIQIEDNCEDTSHWKPRVAKAYAKALMKLEYPHWNLTLEPQPRFRLSGGWSISNTVTKDHQLHGHIGVPTDGIRFGIVNQRKDITVQKAA